MSGVRHIFGGEWRADSCEEALSKSLIK